MSHKRPSSLVAPLLGAIFILAPHNMARGAGFVDSRGEAATFHDGSPQQLIVKYREAAGSSGIRRRIAARLAQRSQSRTRATRRLGIRADVFEMSRTLSKSRLRELANWVENDPAVEWAEPDTMMQALFTPDDPLLSRQWHLIESTAGIGLTGAWDVTVGPGATVAVIDTGIRPHGDLVGNLVGGFDFISNTFIANDGDGRDSDASDPGDSLVPGECGGGFPSTSIPSSWHGTHVSGTVAASTDNARGVAGVAFDTRIVPVRALGKCGGLTSDVADGIIWASGGTVPGVPPNPNPADIINLSLGGTGGCSSTTQSAIDIARANGTTVVVAAGNSNANARNFQPASCRGVITVAATDRVGDRAYYSNFGSDVDLSAPGGDLRFTPDDGVLSTLNDGVTNPGHVGTV